MGDDNATPLFAMLLAFALASVWHVAFYRNRDWAWKERWFPLAAVTTAIVAVVAALVFRYPGSIVVVVAAAVFLTRGIRNTRFCHRCGRTNFLRGNPRPRVCRECGALPDR